MGEREGQGSQAAALAAVLRVLAARGSGGVVARVIGGRADRPLDDDLRLPLGTLLGGRGVLVASRPDGQPERVPLTEGSRMIPRGVRFPSTEECQRSRVRYRAARLMAHHGVIPTPDNAGAWMALAERERA